MQVGGATTDLLTSSSSSLKPGDPVVFLTATGGAFAEYVVADRRAVAKIPMVPETESTRMAVPLVDAGTIPLAGCTAYEALGKLNLRPNAKERTSQDTAASITMARSSSTTADAAADANDQRNPIATADTWKPRVLIVGGAGGVGSWAILLLKAWWTNKNSHMDHTGDGIDMSTVVAADARSCIEIICTASSAVSTRWCESLGADQVIPHDEIASRLGGGPNGSVDAILCLTEPIPSLMKDMSEVIRPFGTICLVVAGPSIQNLDLGFVFFKCADVVTETVFSSFRTNFAAANAATGGSSNQTPSEIMTEILTLTARGELCLAPPRSAATSSFNGKDWEQSMGNGGVLEALASGHTQGKLCMKIADLD